MFRRFTVSSGLIALTLAAGCAPQNATLLEGAWRAYISEDTSFTLAKNSIDLDPSSYDEAWNIDCRDLSGTPDADGDGTNEDEIAAIRLEPRAKVCGRQRYPLELETWIDQGAYRILGNPLEPWRGEAVITGEGDFQVVFHQRIPGGGDFRFGFVIDPNFQPKYCVQSEDGEGTEFADVDGDWVDGWSQDLRALEELDTPPEPLAWFSDYYDGDLYYLNARSYQFNPQDTDFAWSLPNEWRAGHAEGKFVEEFLHARTTRYGKPTAYVAYELDDFESPNPEDMYFCGDDGRCNQLCDDVNADALVVADELAWAGSSPIDAEGNIEADRWYQPMAHCNNWRDPDGPGPVEAGDPDGFSAGLDGWAELHYNWVVIGDGSELVEGGSADGAFSLVLDGDDSQTRVFVRGTFEIDRIKRDRWTTDDVHAIKLAQNNTQICGG